MDPNYDYQFVMIPQQLSSCLDANCGKMLTTLIGLSTIMSKEDGWFYRSNKELQLDTRFSQNLVIATLDTLYQAGIIDIDCVGKGRGHRSNRIHINFESFKKYQQYSFNDIRNNPALWIETVSYKNHYSPSYCKDNGKEIGNTLGKRIGKKVTTNTDTSNYIDIINTKENNIENIDNIYNIDNTKEDIIINNKEDMLINVVEDKDTFYDDKERNLITITEEKTIKEEPMAIMDTIPTVNIEETPESDAVFFKEFLDNPTKDYSGLLGDVTSFVKMNITELNILNYKLTTYYHEEPSTNYILKNLQYYYQEKINKQYQEIIQQA